MRASLSAFFAWAVRERLIAANPVTGTRVPKGGGVRTEIRPFAADELESFHMAASARDQRLAEVLLVASWTGLPRVPVADRVLPLVQACAAGKGPDDLLLTTRTGHQLHAPAAERSVAWSTVAPGRRIHDLRHTAACLWLSQGVDPVTAQAWLGHASIATTNTSTCTTSARRRTGRPGAPERARGAGGAHPERNVE